MKPPRYQQPHGRLKNARWQQINQVNFHCLRSSEHVQTAETMDLTAPSNQKVIDSRVEVGDKHETVTPGRFVNFKNKKTVV